MKNSFVWLGLLVSLASACSPTTGKRSVASVKGGEIGSRPVDGSVVDRPMGRVVAVRRTFKVSLDECQANYVGSNGNGQCQVQKFTSSGETAAERRINSQEGAFLFNQGTHEPQVAITALVDGYRIVPIFSDSDTFEKSKALIAKAIAALPNGEISVVVHTVVE